MKKAGTADVRYIIFCAFALSLILAYLFPMVTDEAYYIDWASRSNWPAMGFFDHPPLVSWLASGVRLIHNIFTARIVVWICSLISIYFVWKTAKILIKDRANIAIAVLASSIGAIAGGFLLTPDTGLTLMWSIAIHQAVLALRGDSKRWVTAGLATGFGILSKYTMVLIGPVLLWALIRDGRRQLRSPWPYLGGLACLLVITPHLFWQSQNDWITFKFQFGHGFSIEQNLKFDSSLPIAKEAATGSPEFLARDRLMAAMAKTPGFAETAPKSKPKKSKWEQAWQYAGDYLGGIAGLWGAYSFALFIYLAKNERKSRPNDRLPRTQGFAIIEASAFFPLVFFAILSPFTKIEANWPAMHMAALAIWCVRRTPIKSQTVLVVTFVHVLVLSVLGMILWFPNDFPGARNNRLLLESKGYRALGTWLNENPTKAAIAVDSYQLKSALRYYAPTKPVLQWPGITRGSEYTRGDHDDLEIENMSISQRELTLISMDPTPRALAGFSATDYRGVRICPDGVLGEFSVQKPILPCTKGLREWWITTYRNQKP